ncbi:MAG: hypothetical protein ABSD98_16445, partial [Candidatus Korobacteraceae bacterium]
GSTPAPKYPVYTQSCPNPENAGYVEICKEGSTQFPPPNQLYDFTVYGPRFNTGPTPIQVPLGDCSGPIQVPSAPLSNPDTIVESPVLGVLVSDVTALAYNSLGMQINELANWTSPDLNAGVGVQAGDVSLETVAKFTSPVRVLQSVRSLCFPQPVYPIFRWRPARRTKGATVPWSTHTR